MEKSYIETLEHIYPTEEQKNKMLDKVFEAAPAKKTKRVKFRYIAAAIAACIVFSTTVVFAEELKSTFYNLLGKNEIVTEKVLNDVYRDTDGHVTMTVKEVLSDTMNTCAIVEYETNGETYMQWLDKTIEMHNEKGSRIVDMLYITPEIKEGDIGADQSFGWEELPEYRTESTRLFKVYCLTDCDEYCTDFIDLKYNLYEKFDNHAVINVSRSVKLKDIKLDSSLAPDKCYKPLGVKISPMSIFIYGQNCGLYEDGILESGGWYCRRKEDANIDSLNIIMKNGKKHDLLHDDVLWANKSFLGAVRNPDVDYDVSIFTTAFKDYIDLTEVDGIELDGVYYNLSEYLQ